MSSPFLLPFIKLSLIRDKIFCCMHLYTRERSWTDHNWQRVSYVFLIESYFHTGLDFSEVNSNALLLIIKKCPTFTKNLPLSCQMRVNVNLIQLIVHFAEEFVDVSKVMIVNYVNEDDKC